MKTQKAVAVWLANFKTEDELRQDYLYIDYEKDDANSLFGNEIKVDYYDEDFMESWWFESLDLDVLETHSEVILHSEHFYADFLEQLDATVLAKYNTLIFLFGEQGEYPINEFLFESTAFKQKETSIQFVYRKIF